MANSHKVGIFNHIHSSWITSFIVQRIACQNWQWDWISLQTFLKRLTKDTIRRNQLERSMTEKKLSVCGSRTTEHNRICPLHISNMFIRVNYRIVGPLYLYLWQGTHMVRTKICHTLNFKFPASNSQYSFMRQYCWDRSSRTPTQIVHSGKVIS